MHIKFSVTLFGLESPGGPGEIEVPGGLKDLGCSEGVGGSQSPTGYQKRTAQLLRATHFYDLLM